jgi:uncharacterized protein with von Willebrand factor type A (vWA) domain
MQRALSELVAALRRGGLAVSTAESIDALSAVAAVGLDNRAELKRVLSLTLVKSEQARALFSRVFDAFFDARGATSGDLFQRLRAQGFSDDEVDAVRALLRTSARDEQGGLVYRSLSEGPGALHHLIENAAQRAGVARFDDPARLGFSTMRVLDALRFSRAEARLPGLRIHLRDALGDRGDALADVLSDELALVRDQVRTQMTQKISDRHAPRALDEVPFEELSPHEVTLVTRAVRELAERLLGRALVRARHARRGRLHVPHTMRKALSTGGAPFLPQFRGQAPRAPKLVVLCDVSDSVRVSARFMLLFMHVAQRLFATARSFVFVGELREATDIFLREEPARAIELAYRGAIVNVADNSNYGRVFRQMHEEHKQAIDARTTLVILGDGRSNHFDPGEQAFQTLARGADRVVWLTPEPEPRWSTADSALPIYRRHVKSPASEPNCERSYALCRCGSWLKTAHPASFGRCHEAVLGPNLRLPNERPRFAPNRGGTQRSRVHGHG